MERLQMQELANIEGGAIGTFAAIFGTVCVGVAFLASVIYGYVHPVKC